MLARMRWALLTAGSLAAAALAYACAVNTSGSCEENGTCPPGPPDGSIDGGDAQFDVAVASEAGDAPAEASMESGVDAGDAGASVEASADASDGGDAAPEAGGCNPALSPFQDPCVLDNRYGVFVCGDAGADMNPGTMALPVATIARGIALAEATNLGRVYICDGNYMENVRVSRAVSLYGGLFCSGDAGWTYGDAGPAQVTSLANRVPLTIDAVDASIAVDDLRLSAASGFGLDEAGNGQSSISTVVIGTTVAFDRCVFVAGSGDNGGDGTPGANFAGPTAPAGQPNDAGAGGGGGSVTCADGTSSTGGNGGTASSTAGQDGGARPLTASTIAGFDGLGATGGVITCNNGDPGANGAAGVVRDAGTLAMGFGTWTDGGWVPAMGASGANGSPGQGGGGGGGKSGAITGGTGGGAGGCGGAGGGGGGGGGASVALVSVNAAVTFSTCTMIVSSGGNGGRGGDGQTGQGGGPPGTPALVGPCIGGFGGNGAGGGGGTGGPGGVSVCVLYRGSAPMTLPTCTHGNAGQPGGAGHGGDGGDNVPTEGNPGVPGPNGAEGGVGAVFNELPLP